MVQLIVNEGIYLNLNMDKVFQKRSKMKRALSLFMVPMELLAIMINI